MGEAKIKREALRRRFLEEMDKWDFPQSQWEADLCEELMWTPVYTVHRAPRKMLEWCRMPPSECHANARFYENNDPDHLTKAVTGWWVQYPNFVLHSVIHTGRSLVCVTPSVMDGIEDVFDFIPDPKVEWVCGSDNYFKPFRLGRQLPVGLRAEPAFTIAQHQVVRTRLLSGMNPADAGKFTDEEYRAIKLASAA